jgi:hypothetical protein
VLVLLWLVLIFLIIVISGLLYALLTRRGSSCVLCDLLKRGKPEYGPVRAPPTRGSQRVPGTVYKRPDPMIYSQEFLIAHGLAVTWDNPDIWVESIGPSDQPSGIIVPAHDLVADTEYFVVARIWNGSVDAPAIGLPIYYSFLTFGIVFGSNVTTTTNTPIGMTQVDLPAKGVAGCPVFAQLKWRTPLQPGHYCLQVRLVWADDAEPGNNMGQKNTDVRALNSPHADFTFPVRNNTRERHLLRLNVDFYALKPPPLCDPGQPPAPMPQLSSDEIAHQKSLAAVQHGRRNFSAPSGWAVKLQPDQLDLGPGEEKMVTVDVNAPEGFNGQQAINVDAMSGKVLAGGVTLFVTGDGH